MNPTAADNVQIPGTAVEFVRDIDKLLTYPDVWLRINRHIESGSDSATIAKAVEMDTDLCARVLRTVNSAFYRLATPVETVSRAVTFLGVDELRNLSFVTVARRLFTGIPADVMDLQRFWSDALFTGVFASALSRRCNVLHPERSYIMGMIHNIGLLALCRYMPDKEREALLIADGDEVVLPDAETEIIGFNHAEVGAALLQQWNLPATLVDVARYHHQPERAYDNPLDVAILHVAMMLTNGVNTQKDYEHVLDQLDESAVALTGVDESVLHQMAAQGADQVDAMARAYETGDAYH